MLRALIVLMSISVGGCLAIRDADDFEEDPFCDFRLPLRNFGIHADQSPQRSLRERFTIGLIRERVLPSGEIERRREAIAVLDPLPGPNVDIRLPNAGVPALEKDQRPLQLEFFADTDNTGAFERTNDHSWFEPHACLASDLPFAHTVDFDDLEGGAPQQFSLTLQPMPEQIAMWQDTIEVRVRTTFVIDESEEQVTRAFFRRASWSFENEMGTELEQATIELPGILRDTESVRITVFVDSNSDGEFQEGTDIAIESVFNLVDCSGSCSRNGNLFTQVVDLMAASSTELEPWWILNDD